VEYKKYNAGSITNIGFTILEIKEGIVCLCIACKLLNRQNKSLCFTYFEGY